jgi:preprotein translocase subunit SecF
MKQKLIFSLVMSVVTTSIISFVLIAINVGFSEQFFTAWLRSWLVSCVLAISSTLFIAPKVQLLLNYLAKKNSHAVKKEEQQ